MRERCLRAIDLRGHPSPLYERTVEILPLAEVERGKCESVGICGAEVGSIRDIHRIPKGMLRVVRGGERGKNRAALEENIHMLACPYPFDYVMAGLAAKKNIGLEINVREIINASGVGRMRLLQNLHVTVSLALKYRAPLVITSGSRMGKEVKHPRVLVAFGRILGLDYPLSKSCIYHIPKKILEGVT
jgi:RNase P/RNase MRP subunit p30